MLWQIILTFSLAMMASQVEAEVTQAPGNSHHYHHHLIIIIIIIIIVISSSSLSSSCLYIYRWQVHWLLSGSALGSQGRHQTPPGCWHGSYCEASLKVCWITKRHQNMCCHTLDASAVWRRWGQHQRSSRGQPQSEWAPWSLSPGHTRQIWNTTPVILWLSTRHLDMVLKISVYTNIDSLELVKKKGQVDRLGCVIAEECHKGMKLPVLLQKF